MLDFNSSYEPADDSLTSMLLKKEKELQELSKLRISQLQDQIIFKDKTIAVKELFWSSTVYYLSMFKPEGV